MERPLRSLVKAISWRIVATMTTVFLVFLFSGNLVLSGSVGVTELATKTVVFYVHERIWNRFDFGRKKA
jgi:uncharacterized membrane protein